MNQILLQVTRAKRRVLTGQFFNHLTFALFIGLMVTLLGVAIPKIWYLGLSPEGLSRWLVGWLLCGIGLALTIASVRTFLQSAPLLSIATEVDRRFGLKERLSTALCLTPEELDSEVGRALLTDAQDRAATIDVRDEFRYQPAAKAALPLLPSLGLLAMLLIPNAEEPPAKPASSSETVSRQQLEVMIDEARKKREKRNDEATAGLKDDDQRLVSLERRFDDLVKQSDLDKKSALVKLNDIKREIEERKRELGGGKELKENLNRLKDIARGPAKQLSEALGKGDMPEAQKALKDLAEKLRDNKLSDVEKKQLANDLEAMAKELKKAAEQRAEEREKLKEQLQQALEKGDLDKAAQLQEKLDQNEKQQQQAERMQKLAQKLQDCAECMKEGGGGQKKEGQPNAEQGKEGGPQSQSNTEAAEALDEIADIMRQMQAEMDELEDLEDLEKLAGECKQCIGQGGCENDDWKEADWAKGGGIGAGRREIADDDTGGFRSRIRPDLQQGERVVIGTADGDNISGRSTEEVRRMVQEGMSKDTDPLENQTLPRAQREHAQQYFEALRRSE